MKKDVAEEILWMFQELEEDMDEDSSTSNG
jgi:hypothetical protein